MSMFEPRESYRRVFFSDATNALMLRTRIVGLSNTAQSLIDKLARRVAASEAALGEAREDTRNIIRTFEQYVEDGVCILGSPLLTNIAAERLTLASCTAVPLDMHDISFPKLGVAENYYNLNMGSGYNLDRFDNPVDALLTLNSHAKHLEKAGSCERYIGNIAHVGIAHPAVIEFAQAKTTHLGLKHFNISIDLSEAFMEAVASNGSYILRNGNLVSAVKLWDIIVQNAWTCGDPGLISLHRFNADNSVAATSPYTTTAPCAEVGLANGESCVFGYINLAACLRWKDGKLDIDLEQLGSVTECLTRVLDDCVTNSLSHFPTPTSNDVMASNRKIGIGVCGFADSLLWIGLDYGSDESCALLRAALSTITFRSKHASMELAARRGAFPQFLASRYANDPAYVVRFAPHSSGIDERHWRKLAEDVARFGLRNTMTTAIPPSGRTSLLLGVNASIEPMLDHHTLVRSMPIRTLTESGNVRTVGTEKDIEVDDSAKCPTWPRRTASSRSMFRTATALTVSEHISVLATACKLVDDGVSKTVNLASSAGVTDVDAAFKGAWNAGLKAISVYRAQN